MKFVVVKLFAFACLIGFALNAHAQEPESQRIEDLEVQLETLQAELRQLRTEQNAVLRPTMPPNGNDAIEALPTEVTPARPGYYPPVQVPTPAGAPPHHVYPPQVQRPYPQPYIPQYVPPQPNFVPVYVQPPVAPVFVEPGCFIGGNNVFLGPGGWGFDLPGVNLNFSTFGNFGRHPNQRFRNWDREWDDD